ncbi:hypothetical protein [Xanthomonas theicola]|uniref:Uncharacterized protein n=1 Tax=Xanthomonas theicola TaxID=56464 RepID=A0A2S6ZDT9_9XANT|nr:hypothetical protein [Xanthomonas theicola]PPT90445.1 hypothetical protein XthCFBP4691_12260 [Xanthomonas theicola]QNH25249.1 hypothetical protein G4Q83_11550 [Xanthomonas theicola]
MHQLSFSEIIKQALLGAGCDPALIQQLDDHATVQIDLDGCPPMFVGDLDGRTMIWSDLCEFHDSIVRLRSEALLREIMAEFRYSANRQSALRESEGQLQAYAELVGECLDSADAMGEAINAFFLLQQRLLEIVRQ